MQVPEEIGYLFYIASPNKTSFKTVDEVPDYNVKMVPIFLACYLLEQAILLCRRKRTARINDTSGSVFQGLFTESVRIMLQGWKLAVYVYLYDNYRLVDLQWNSPMTWWIAFITTDFFYYWAHRASHEVNFIWASHQVHHSSEDYNFSTALRQSVLQSYLYSWIYLPMAFVVPPAAYYVHSTFNMLYQFWIHTEMIKSLGPLEYILNTPSHHRVHHGRNRYCIDKNYGGTLIIWDRLFGTFEAEAEEVVYGLTSPINTFSSFYIQFWNFWYIFRQLWIIPGWKNKLSVVFKGPGWSPGKPRLGCIEDIPDVHAPSPKYDPPVPFLQRFDVWAQGFIVFFMSHQAFLLYDSMSKFLIHSVLVYGIISLEIFGLVLDGRRHACWLQVLRCIVHIPLDLHFLPQTAISQLPVFWQKLVLGFLRSLNTMSLLGWSHVCLKEVNFKLNLYGKKVD